LWQKSCNSCRGCGFSLGIQAPPAPDRLARAAVPFDGIQEVSGSIPLISTIEKACSINDYRLFCF
jgi:hypothetical protein